MKKLLVLLCTAVLSSRIVLAAPSISNISGTVGDGQTITIGGSSFNSKSSAAPLVWDNVESGQFSSAWGDTKDLSVTSSGQRHARSTRSGFLNFTGSDWDGDFQAQSATYQKWFVQYWFKVDSNWDWGSSTYGGGNSFLSNIKIFRMWNPGDTDENFVVALNGWENSAEFVMEGTGEPRRYLLGDYKNLFTKGNWHLLQFEYADNSSVGASDGEFRAWFDGRLVANQGGMKTRESFSGFKRPFIIGFSNVWEASGGGGENTPNNFYIDDVYADNTWARVELGNSSTYDNCTVREIQPTTSWGSSSVQVRVNAGSFNSGNTAYLYVTDANGEVNSSGYPVTIGGGSNPPPPVNQAPQVSINIPTTNATHTTVAGLASILISGTASDDTAVTNVTWSNSRGGSGTATNGGNWQNWSIPALALIAGGAANVLTITATDGSGATSTDQLSITVPALPVNQAPQAAITLPTTSANYTTAAGATALNISGTASDDTAVTNVTWVNNRGGSGSASTTNNWANWSISNIPLVVGQVNTVTITVTDGAGATSTDQLAITVPQVPVNQAPQAVITGPTSSANYTTTAGQTSIQVSGTSSDDNAVTNVTWVNNRGGSGTASTANNWGNWSIANLPLVVGQVNTVTITATDGAGLTVTDQIAITVPAVPVNQAPQVGINGPTSNTNYTASAGQSTIQISGTASDDNAVTNVTWSNSRGGSGTATNLSGSWTSWRVSNLPLEVGQTNTVTVTVTDAAGLTSTDQIVITVPQAPANQAPQAAITGPTSSANYTATAGQTSIQLSGTASDDTAVTNVTWVNNRGGSGTASSSNNWATWSIASVPLVVGQVNTVTITVSDGAGATSTDQLAITVPVVPVNQGPQAAITAPTSNTNYTAPAGQSSIQIMGTASDDTAVTNVTWVNNRGGSGSATNVSGNWTSWRVSNLPLVVGQVNTITVTVSDGAGLTVTDQIVITVPVIPPTNQAPQANAGSDQSLQLPATASLVGSAQDDGLPNGGMTYVWSKVSGPGDVQFGSGGAAQTTASFSAAGSYVCRLTVNDGAMSDTDDIGIIVGAPPVVTTGNNNPTEPSGRQKAMVKPGQNQNAELSYDVNEAGNVKITVNNRFGDEVKMLENNYKERGVYQVLWDGRSNTGSLAASGMYVVQIDTAGGTVKKKVVLIK